MAHSTKNGNKIIFRNNKEGWVYEDSTPASIDRPCPHCGLLPTPEGHDGCLGTLPGVRFACCGHGIHRGYIQFTNGVIIRGNFTIEVSTYTYKND